MKKIVFFISLFLFLNCVSEVIEEDFSEISEDLEFEIFEIEEIDFATKEEILQCKNCDDEKECTEDSCNSDGNCIYNLVKDYCLINGVCVKKGEKKEGCKICEPEKSPYQWTLLEDKTNCNDNNECTAEDKCKNGVCKGVEIKCNDNNLCTDDYCEPQKGCVFLPVISYCEDGNLCTLGDYCENGLCISGNYNECDDNNPCTEDYCENMSGKCFYKNLNKVPCDDENLCTLNDTCEEGICKSIEELNCNDGNICTFDGCNPLIGCYHDIAENPCCEGGVSVCDDMNSCTDDNCDPQSWECKHTFNNAVCDDGKNCTEIDTCKDGICTGKAKNCYDANPCTDDFCDEKKGCQNVAISNKPCDDGLSCSVGDHCENGVCVADKSNCGCIPEFSEIVSKINFIAVGENGFVGNGLNIDENPQTCAPLGNCAGGIDNSLGAMGSIGNPSLLKALEKGNIIILFEHKDLKTDGTPYTFAAYGGKLDPLDKNCNFQVMKCNYLVDKDSINLENCKPIVSFDNAKIVGGKFSAGGKKYNFPFEFPLFGGIKMPVNLYFARIEADLILKDNKIIQMKGILAGAIPKAQIIEGIEKAPEEELPIDKKTLIELVNALVYDDIDTDNNGKKDAASIGIKFSTIEGKITGIK